MGVTKRTEPHKIGYLSYIHHIYHIFHRFRIHHPERGTLHSKFGGPSPANSMELTADITDFNGGFLKEGSPIAGWFFEENPIHQWIIQGYSIY